MRVGSSNFNISNALTEKEIVVRVAIEGFTNKYVSGSFQSIAATDKKFLKAFSAVFPKIDILKQPFPKSGTFSFEIMDDALEITAALNSGFPINKNITVDLGFEDLVIGDFLTLETQKLTDPISLASDLQSYSFVSRDVRRLLKGNIGRKRSITALDADITAGGAIISVDSITGFIDPANLPNQFDTNTAETGFNKAAWIKLQNNEVIRYGLRDAGGNDFETVQRNNMDSVISTAGHASGTVVEQVFGFQNQYPTEALLYVLLTTDDGTGHAFYDLATFDDGFKGMGFETSIAAADVDIEGIERLGWKFFNVGIENCMQTIIDEEVNGLDWIIENILKPGGLYMYIDAGIIKVRTLDRLDLITDFSADDDLVKDDLVNGRIDSYIIDHKTLLNRINFSWYINPLSQTKRESWEFKLDDSVTQYGGIEEPFIINSKLVAFDRVAGVSMPHVQWRTDRNIEDQVREVIVRRWLYTFDNPLGVMDVHLMPDKWKLQPTDWITLTDDLIPDVNDGTRGWTNKKFFITEQRMNPLLSPPLNKYKALTWEAISDVSDPYSFTTIAQGTIDDTDIAFNANNTITTNTEDGFWDTGGIAQSALQILIIKLGITPPNTGSTHHWVKLTIHLIENTGSTLLYSQHYRAIRYLSSDSAEFDVEFVIIPIYPPSVGFGTDRIKVDWWDASDGSTERPSAITFKEIKYGALGNDMSSVKELLN